MRQEARRATGWPAAHAVDRQCLRHSPSTPTRVVSKRNLEVQPNFFDRVYRVVALIPAGRVASYGQIAALLGHPRSARTVGWALNSLSSQQARTIPWQRVINSAGRISFARLDLGIDLQRQLLEGEGVVFNERGLVDLAKYGWQGMDAVEVEALWHGDAERR
jgi:methylated-DNA-protein-cysteine methyltransferase-like protein